MTFFLSFGLYFCLVKTHIGSKSLITYFVRLLSVDSILSKLTIEFHSWALIIFWLLMERKSVAIFSQKSTKYHRRFCQSACRISRIRTSIPNIVWTSWCVKTIKFWSLLVLISISVGFRFVIFWVRTVRWYTRVGSLFSKPLTWAFKVTARRLNTTSDIVYERGRFLLLILVIRSFLGINNSLLMQQRSRDPWSRTSAQKTSFSSKFARFIN